MKNLLITLAALTICSSFIGVGSIKASEVPSFGSCLTPTGTVKANYASGDHGIVGDSNLHSGSDAVYTLSNDSLMQCFCADNGSGTQTNWYRIPEISEQELQVLKSQGWIYIPSGAAWGLDDVPYLAKNLDYQCKSSNPGGPGDGRSDGRSDGKSDGKGSIVQSATGNSLASTGNIVFLLGLLSLGSLLTLSGIILKRKSK